MASDSNSSSDPAASADSRHFADLPKRFESEAGNLVMLTGWELNTIHEKMAANGQSFTVQAPKKLKWYQKLWKQ